MKHCMQVRFPLLDEAVYPVIHDAQTLSLEHIKHPAVTLLQRTQVEVNDKLYPAVQFEQTF